MDLSQYPYPSRRSALVAPNGVVAACQPMAAQAGLSMLQRGGNAVDAALATAMALTVLDPSSNGIGGDAFAIVWDGAKLHGLNGSGRWPAAMNAQSLRDQGMSEIPLHGWSPVSVPGAPDAWHTLHERFGTQELSDIMAPAISYAEQGFPVAPVSARLWASAAEDIMTRNGAEFDGWRETFLRGGKTPAAGEIWTLPGYAAGLRAMAENGFRDFYEGSIAERILDYSNKTGGALCAEDLKAHHSEWVDLISASYRGHEVWEIPPNGQGIAALETLALLEGTDVADHAHMSEAGWHTQIEAMKLAFNDAYRYVGDPAHASAPQAVDLASKLLDPAYIEQRRKLIGETAGTPGPGTLPKGGTVYFCVADRNGMMVSFIQSTYYGFGSGITVPDVGVSLQNRAAGFTLEADHPNEAMPGKRPRHTIIPGFLTRDGAPVGPFGVMGGEMQPQGHAQVVAAMLDHGMNPQAALDAPRWRVSEDLQSVLVEAHTPADIITGLKKRGHRVEFDIAGFGRGQIITRMDNGAYLAGSEPRADGAALGY